MEETVGIEAIIERHKRGIESIERIEPAHMELVKAAALLEERIKSLENRMNNVTAQALYGDVV